MEPIRAASVGLGWWGGVLAEAGSRADAVNVVRCYARTPESREAFAVKHNCVPAETLDEVLADKEVEALIVATPHSTHLEIIEAAAEAGKHVFVEKPLTLTVEEGKAAITATADSGVVLQVGHHRRREPANRGMRELIDDGALGTIHQLEATHFVPTFQNPVQTWRANPEETPVGGMTGLGVHQVDTFSYLVGPVARVAAFSKSILGRWAIDDATVVGFEFESGPLGYLGTSLVLPWRIDIGVYGHEGAAWSVEDGARLYRQNKDERSRHEEPVGSSDAVADQLVEFAQCIREGGRPETGGPEALEVVAVLEAIIESTRSGHPVDVAGFR